MNSMTGEQSICFEKPPYLFASASVAVSYTHLTLPTKQVV